MKHPYYLIQRMFKNLRSSRGDKYGEVIMRMFGVDEKEAILICYEFGYHAHKRITPFDDNAPAQRAFVEADGCRVRRDYIDFRPVGQVQECRMNTPSVADVEAVLGRDNKEITEQNAEVTP